MYESRSGISFHSLLYISVTVDNWTLAGPSKLAGVRCLYAPVVGITINLYTDSLFKQYREVAFIRIESTQFQIRFCINLYDISFRAIASKYS